MTDDTATLTSDDTPSVTTGSLRYSLCRAMLSRNRLGRHHAPVCLWRNCADNDSTHRSSGPAPDHCELAVALAAVIGEIEATIEANDGNWRIALGPEVADLEIADAFIASTRPNGRQGSGERCVVRRR